VAEGYGSPAASGDAARGRWLGCDAPTPARVDNPIRPLARRGQLMPYCYAIYVVRLSRGRSDVLIWYRRG